MKNETENQMSKAKQVPDFYIFENAPNGERSGAPAGAGFRHKKGQGFTLLIAGKRYAAFPPKAKSAQAEATEGKGA